MPNVSNIVKSIQDIMRKDAGTYGDAQRLEQLGWMFFLKIFDDREEELELRLDHYKSPLPKHLRWRNWAKDDEGITGEALLDFVNNTLLPKLKSLTGGADKIAGLIRMTFDDANNYMKNGTLMRQVINKINGIDFNASDDRHLFGDIYEKILKDLQSAGNAGEFYTPRAVTQFIVEQVNPNLKKRETILDPACGTGGFLTCVIDHLRKQAKIRSRRTAHSGLFQRHRKETPAACAVHDQPAAAWHRRAVQRASRQHAGPTAHQLVAQGARRCHRHQPAVRRHGRRRHRKQLSRRVPHPRNRRSVPGAADALLKPGGRAGLVLPDGTLFGEGVKTRIKEALLTDCNLHTIVRLPNGVFNPYTGIRTNLLFFTKGQPTQQVWYYEHPYPPGAKSYNKGKPIRIEEFEAERQWWGNEADGFAARVENEQAWRVSIDTIKAGNYNLDLKNPHNPDTGPGDVDHLLPEYEKLLQQIAATREELKAQLQQALTR